MDRAERRAMELRRRSVLRGQIGTHEVADIMDFEFRWRPSRAGGNVHVRRGVYRDSPQAGVERMVHGLCRWTPPHAFRQTSLEAQGTRRRAATLLTSPSRVPMTFVCAPFGCVRGTKVGLY